MRPTAFVTCGALGAEVQGGVTRGDVPPEIAG